MTNKYVFGPVPSRRLGVSLGIDIIPMKTCTYNCVYCQLFQTSNHTTTRQSFVNKEDVLNEIRQKLSESEGIDYITFSGSGEPTLNSDIGNLINSVKTFSDIPVAVITNSSLLWDPEVRKDLSSTSLVVPSVDSITPELWKKVNRPAANIELAKILEGLKIFCDNHNGMIWLEVMLVKGINDDREEILKIADYVNTLKVDKVQINTVVRPPNEPDAKPLEKEFLEEVVSYFKHDTEIIASFKKASIKTKSTNQIKLILDLLSRRPCKPQEMADSLGINLNELSKNIALLIEDNRIMKEPSGHYSIKH